MSRITRRAAIAGLLALAAGACGERPPPTNRLVIATGGKGGVYYALGHALATIIRRNWGIEVDVRQTGASIENLHLIGEGTADLAFATVDAVALALFGQSPFPARQPVNSLALLYDEYLHAVTLADDDVFTMGDLAGKPVSIGANQSGTELVSLRLLKAAGVKASELHHLGVAESVAALREGDIRAFFFVGGLPTPAIADLARGLPIRLLPLDAYVAKLQRDHSGVYVRRTIPATAYGMPSDIPTLGVHTLLVTGARMPDEVAYQIARLLFASRDELAAAHSEARHLNQRVAIFTDPAQLHPGAIRYYQEVKQGVAG